MAMSNNKQNGSAIDEHTKPAFLRRVRISGYKSIANCDVQLHPLTILVGRNATGKSNFIDALAFLRDILDTNVADAVRRRGGWSSIICRTVECDRISIQLEVEFVSRQSNQSPKEAHAQSASSRYHAQYGTAIATFPAELPFVAYESFRITDESGQEVEKFERNHPSPSAAILQGPKTICNQVLTRFDKPTLVIPDKLVLSVLGDHPLADLNAGLRRMGFYNFSPEEIRQPDKSSPGLSLDRSGKNLASVINALREDQLNRVRDYLRLITPEVQDFYRLPLGEYETVRFRIESGQEFDAASMSDGTLRALASLMAVSQTVLPYGHPTVVGIEEPETSLHPGAVRALIAALNEATEHTQVLLTTHSADLLSDPDIDPSSVLVVRKRAGQTEIAPIDPASRKIIDEELYSLAELQQMDQLELDESAVHPATS